MTHFLKLECLKIVLLPSLSLASLVNIVHFGGHPVTFDYLSLSKIPTFPLSNVELERALCCWEWGKEAW